jgi:ABC-2 type transport system permease protein
MPLRIFAVVPIAALAVAATGGERLTRDPLLLALFPVTLVGAWLITFLAMSVIGALAFWVESSGALFEVWLGLFGVFSGYLVPLELFPRWLEAAARFLPFRYMLAFPVEMIIGLTPRRAALLELAIQWAFVVGLAGAARLAWRSGLRRFAAYGG